MRKEESTQMKKLFIKLPTELLLDKSVTRSTLILAAALIDLQDDCGCIDQRIEDLERYTGLSDKTIRRGLRELHDIGLIRYIGRTGRGSYIWLSDQYCTHRDYSAIKAQIAANIKAERERRGA